MSPKISILMPVFNGSSFLAETLDSIKKQSFIDYEVICVDDCSTDNSLDILNTFGDLDSRFRVFSTESNLGTVPKVLNFSIDLVKGDYFAYCSQDDFFSSDWLEAMYCKAEQENADATMPVMVFFYGPKDPRNTLLSGIEGDKTLILSGYDAFILSLNWDIHGFILWKVWLIKKFKFFDFSMNADEYTVRFYLLNSNRLAFSGGTFFYRQNNANSIGGFKHEVQHGLKIA